MGELELDGDSDYENGEICMEIVREIRNEEESVIEVLVGIDHSIIINKFSWLRKKIWTKRRRRKSGTTR